MNNGWIKLHRKFIDWEWFKEPNMVHLFLYFMLIANHEEGKWKGQTIQRGQFVTGRVSLSKNTGISEQSIRTCIERLKSTNEITTKSTNKYTIITITKYNDYQKDDKKSTKKLTYGLTNNQPTTNQQLTTNKNNKNEENDKNNTSEPSSQDIVSLIDLFKKINPTYKILFGRPPQRQACSRLLELRSVPEWEKVIDFLVFRRNDKFCPTISTPIQLENKYADLEKYGRGLKEPSNKYKVAF